jgi:hypothetical protein
MSLHDDPDLDLPLWSARQIGAAAGVFEVDEHGKVVKDETGQPKVDLSKTFHLISIGVIPAKHVKGFDKNGKQKARGHLISSRRLIRDSLLLKATV